MLARPETAANSACACDHRPSFSPDFDIFAAGWASCLHGNGDDDDVVLHRMGSTGLFPLRFLPALTITPVQRNWGWPFQARQHSPRPGDWLATAGIDVGVSRESRLAGFSVHRCGGPAVNR